VACWLTYAAGYADPARPAFFRSSDPVFLWGGPNVDQVARRAPITGDGVFRVSGAMGACEEFVLQVKTGATQSGGADIATELSASSLGLGPGDSFEITFGGEERSGHWYPLPEDASFVHVRDYYFDWRPREPATFVIERLDTQGTPAPRVTATRVAAMLDDAAHEVEHSMVFWKDYQVRMRETYPVGAMGAPVYMGRGVRDIMYSHGFVSLADDEAMVVTLDPADADLWDVQLYNRTWYEGLDFTTRVTSLNHRQVFCGSDGLVRIVISGTDPGVPNWLDNEGRTEVLATVRWMRPPADPTVRSEIVAGDALADVLPADTPTVGPVERAAERASRAAHSAWRYRS